MKASGLRSSVLLRVVPAGAAGDGWVGVILRWRWVETQKRTTKTSFPFVIFGKKKKQKNSTFGEIEYLLRKSS